MTFVTVVAACLLGARVPWAVVRSSVRLQAVRGDPAVAGAWSGATVSHRVPSPVTDLDTLVLLDLLDAAISAGTSLPRALAAVGEAAGGGDGQVMARASSALIMGADWRAAWQGAPVRLGPVVDGLAPTWDTGAAPGPALRAAADHLRRERRTAAREAAGRLGVYLVLPLGLCFLPAFVLIGLVPVLLSLGSGLLG
ncbi:MAG TPA: type II secretion system F family protein [Cellulomonas sp.]